nr:MAG TPA: hypothetical protein [Caudoviricetes sp.]
MKIGRYLKRNNYENNTHTYINTCPGSGKYLNRRIGKCSRHCIPVFVLNSGCNKIRQKETITLHAAAGPAVLRIT